MRMRTKILLVASFVVGYYFGAKAGRERYEQMRKAVDAVPVDKVVRKGKALADLGVERVSSLRGSRGAVVIESDAAVLPASSIRSAGSAPV
jgi:hypothetical protein